MFVRLCLLSVLAIGASALPANSQDRGAAKSTVMSDGPIVMTQFHGTKTPRGYRGSPPCGFIIPC